MLTLLGTDIAALEPQHLSALVGAGAVVLAAIVALTLTRRQMVIADRNATAAVFLAIAAKWDAIYPLSRKLIADDRDAAMIIAENPDFDLYAQTEEWQEMRKVFAFYEHLGALLRARLLREHVLFSLVTVNVALWDKFSPLIAYYREAADMRDLYTGWEYLAQRRRLYPSGEAHLKRTWWRRALRSARPKRSGAREKGRSEITPPFGELAALRDRPIPDQTEFRDIKSGYRAHPLDPCAPQNDERLVEARGLGLRGENFYSSRRNPPHYRPIPGATSCLWVRQGVAERLLAVQRRLLAAGLSLWILDAWRPTSVQSYFHDHWVPNALRARRPDIDDESLAKAVSSYWAAPADGPGHPSPHLTGAAVDLTICWADTGRPLWFGSLFDDVSLLSHLDRFEGPPPGELTISDDEARANRRLLHWVMVEEGFCAHPNEWWHFSFGDQMWARLTGAPAAFYGAARPPEK